MGSGGAAEYYAFVYREDRVKEVDGHKGLCPEQQEDDFSREPFFATFKSGNFDFTLITVHITSPHHAALATAEVGRLKDVWTYVQQLDSAENDIYNTPQKLDRGIRWIRPIEL